MTGDEAPPQQCYTCYWMYHPTIIEGEMVCGETGYVIPYQHKCSHWEKRR